MKPSTVSTPDFFAAQAASSYAPKRLRLNTVLSWICIGISFATLLPLASILILLVSKGLPLLSWQTLTSLPPASGMLGGGFGNAIVGSLIMVGIGLLIAAPLGILAAIYINEYSLHGRLSQAVRFVAKLLTGIPSIICGVFAFAVIVSTTGGFSAFAGGFALAILMLPTILLTSEQALLGVPSAFREASYGLGATKFQTITRIVLPDALPAMMTGVMLAVARAAGETAPLLFTALFSQYWMNSLMEPTASLSVLIYNFATLPFDHQIQLAWTASLILVIIVTAINVYAQLFFAKKTH